MDGAEFFTMLFGCDRFEHLVGELMLATLARVGDKASPAQLEKVRVRPIHASMLSNYCSL